MPDDMKLCRDCRHFRSLEAEWLVRLGKWEEDQKRRSAKGYYLSFCMPAPPTISYVCRRKVSPVTGERLNLCASKEREDHGACASHMEITCGPAARYWEAKTDAR
jgi:hypothetical protein